jgi:hypothetical protein
MQVVLPDMQTSAMHVPLAQYSSGLQSIAPTHCTQMPCERSQSWPIAVHIVSEVHLFAHELFTHLLFIGQSLVPTHSTQRMRVVSQTWPCGQAREFMHAVYGLQVCAMQSLLIGQSLAPTQVTHLPDDGSHTGLFLSAVQSLLLVQAAAGITQCVAWQRRPDLQSLSE